MNAVPPRLTTARVLDRAAVSALLLCLATAGAVAGGESGGVAVSDGPAPAQAAETVERRGDLVSVFSGDIHVPANTRLYGTVVCVGGDVVIDGEVRRDVVVILGNLRVTGSVGGQITGVFTDMVFQNARVSRELVSVLGSVELENTQVSREMINILGDFKRDALSSEPTIDIGSGWWSPNFWVLLTYVRLLHKLVVFVLVLLLVALVPERVRLIGEEAPPRYVPAFFVGILGYLGLLVVMGLLTVTVVGIPLAIFGFYVLKWLGIAGIFYAVGWRLGKAFGREMSVLGAVLVVFALYVGISMVPSFLGLAGLLFLGLLRMGFFLFVELPAVGLVILTLAGGRGSRPGQSGHALAPPAPVPSQVPAPPGSPALPSSERNERPPDSASS